MQYTIETVPIKMSVGMKRIFSIRITNKIHVVCIFLSK